MATHHAKPNEVVDLSTWAQDMPDEKSKIVLRTEDMEVARLVMPAGKVFEEHKVTGPITVHCIKGTIEFNATGVTQNLKSGQLLYLLPGEAHTLTALEDTIILLTIVFKH